MSLYKILDHPGIFNLSQKILSFGRTASLAYIADFLIKNSQGKILDLGCGTGRYSGLFREDYVALDINLEYLRYARSRVGKFICADSQYLPFKAGIFNTVFCVGFFHHISPSITQVILEEIVRVTCPGSRILIVDFFYPDNKIDLLGKLVSMFDRGKYVRRRLAFTQELSFRFNIVSSANVCNSYPYNAHTFIIQPRE